MKIKQKEWTLLARKWDSYCPYCKKYVEDNEVSVDHKIPRSRGGRNIISNIVLCCRQCNTDKGNQLIYENQS